MKAIRLLFLVAALGPPAIPVGAQDCDRLDVDIADRVVAGVPVDTGAASLAERLGTDQVVRETEYLETEPSPVLVLDLCGHAMRRHWNGLSWDDPAFATTEGARVGQPIAAFDSTYGVGQPMWSEAGVVVAYPTGEWDFFAGIDQDCVAPVDEMPPRLSSRSCVVRRLWIPLHSPIE